MRPGLKAREGVSIAGLPLESREHASMRPGLKAREGTRPEESQMLYTITLQ